MKKYLLISIFVFTTLILGAQNYYGKRIGIESGLSQVSVTCVQYDNYGSVWIGTRFGLNEYRNNRMRSFMNCTISGLYCDSDDRLWVLTEQGVSRYDKLSDSFESISPIAATCIFEKDDVMYLGTHNGIATYDKNGGIFTEGSSSVWNDYCDIFEYETKLVFVDKRQGITLLENGKEKKLELPFIEGKTIMTSCNLGSILVLCILGEGVLIYNLDLEDAIHYYPAGKNGLSKDLIISSEIIDGQLWLGTDGSGIMVMDPSSGFTTSFYEGIAMNPGTEVPSSVTCIYKDPLNTIWIGGDYFGVTGLRQAPVVSYLPKDIINTIYNSEDGYIYIGSDGGGLLRMDKDGPVSIASTQGMKITSICDYDKDHLLICGYNQGYFVLNRHTGNKRPLIIVNKQVNARECLYGNAPTSHRLPDGRVILFADNHYLHDPKTGSFTMLKDNSIDHAKDLKGIDGKYGDRYTYCRDGIFEIDLENKCLNLLYDSREKGEAINSLACIDSLAFYGTNNGLFCFDFASRESTEMNTGLLNRITELCSTREGSLWIGADNSLFYLNNGVFKLIGENMGVFANELKTSAVSDKGTIYLGGTAGLLEIRNTEDVFTGDEINRCISLHDLTVEGSNITSRNELVKLPYDFKNFGIRISVQGADPLEKMAYKYLISGPSSFEIESYEDNVSIPTLKPGNYTVEVSYQQSRGQWSEPQKVAEVRVKRPWYTSTLMLIVYLLTTVAILVLLAIYVQKRTREAMQREMRAKDFQFISKFEKYIDEHLEDNNLNVNDICAALAMSRATLYTKVKSTYDTGIGEYIETKRIEKAIQLLTGTDLSVAEIADKVGYSTPRYFSTRFKSRTGTTPLAYRRARR